MVGSSLMRMLKAEGYINIVTRSHSELDLTRQNDVEKFFEREKPEYVFLAAAKVGGILANDTYRGDFIYNNIMIAANIIHTAYKSGAVKLLNLGSSCIYPKFASQPMREEALLTGSLEPTNEPYAIAKIAALKLCRYYNEQYRTDFISVMPTNLYGPHDNFNLETSHVLPALIRKFHLAKLLRNNEMAQLQKDIQAVPLGFDMNEKSTVVDEESVRKALERLGISEDCVVIWGTGEVYREFLHVDDLADACVYLMNNYNDSGIVNIGTGKDTTIRELADIIQRVVGFDGNVTYDTTKPDGTMVKRLDVSRLNNLGWKPSIALRSGISDVYNWYKDQL